MEWQGRIRESEHHENQNDAVSSHEGHGFYKEMESSPKKTKTGASRRPTDVLSWTFRAFLEQDENTSFQEIARQVKDDIKSLVGQIVSKQRDNSYSFDSLTVPFEVEQKFDDSIPEKLAHFIQKHFWGER